MKIDFAIKLSGTAWMKDCLDERRFNIFEKVCNCGENCSKLGHWIMNIEEGGGGPLESSEITEEQRLRVFLLDYDSVEGSMQTWACQMTNGEAVNYDFIWN
jgi:hypothetical protein